MRSAAPLFLLAIVASACGVQAAGGEEPRPQPSMSSPTSSDPVGPRRNGRPAPCGLWRLADPGVITDDYAFIANNEMEDVRLAGPPIAWSRVRDVRFEIIPWLKGANRVVEFSIDGITPACAGDRLLVVDDKLAIYGIKPSKTPGRWRIEGLFSEEELPGVERVLAGKNECQTLADPEKPD